MPAGTLHLVAKATKKRGKGRKSKSKSKKAVDKKQNKRIKELEKKVRGEQGWVDSYRIETTANRTPQMIAAGRQGLSTATPFFSLAADTDTGQNDHTRIGLSIHAQRVKGRLTLITRGSAAGTPIDTGSRTGKNNVRLLGVIYATAQDYSTGLAQVLQNASTMDSHPARLIESYYKKQSLTKWKIWMDEVVSVPFTTTIKRVNFDYKVPAEYQKMVYDSNSLGDPQTNIMVLYAMTGIRDNGENQVTIQGTYRCTFEK